jgi:preprotein translocase subunit SecE
MAANKSQERIVALQKQLKIAREALTKAAFGDLRSNAASNALDEMDKIEWASKPNLVQQIPAYLGRLR